MRGWQGDDSAEGVEVDVEPGLPRQHVGRPDVGVVVGTLGAAFNRKIFNLNIAIKGHVDTCYALPDKFKCC